MSRPKIMRSNENALVAFSIENVRSYRENTELSLDALRSGNPNVVHEVNTAATQPLQILPVLGIWGANASGKTAILRAMTDMRFVVLNSFRRDLTGNLRKEFLLSGDNESRGRPSAFHVELILDGILWLYGFEIDDESVLKEYAYFYPRGRRVLVFERDDEGVDMGKQFKSFGKKIDVWLKKNALLISTVEGLNESVINHYEIGARLVGLFNWFRTNMVLAQAANRDAMYRNTATLGMNEQTRERVIDMLKFADLGLTDIEIEKVEPNELPLDAEQTTEIELRRALSKPVVKDIVKLKHQSAINGVFLNPEDESLGTKVWVALVSPILCALDNGSVLLVDELDSSLHSELVKSIVELFQSPDSNPYCAQLLFNSNDLEVLKQDERFTLGRDQIWFTDKNVLGECNLYSLASFKGRRDDVIAKRYMDGRYGALPSIKYWLFEALQEEHLAEKVVIGNEDEFANVDPAIHT